MSLRRWLAAAVIPALVLAGTAAADGEPGSSSSDGDGNVDAMIAVGAVVLVSGILIYDILSDGPQDQEAPDGETPALVPTGVDWSSIDPAAPGELSLVVASGGSAAESMEFLAQLEERVPVEYTVFPDVVELGGVSGDAAFELASSFFGADIVVVVSTAEVDVIGPGGSIWSGPAGDMDGLLAALESEAVR